MWLRKAVGGSGAAGLYWENDGDVVEVSDHIAIELLEVKGHDFSEVAPPEPDGEPDSEPDGDESTDDKPKPRRGRPPKTPVAE